MATAGKKTGIKHAILTLVALVIIIGVYVGITQFSNIAKSITERIASNALQTPVSISQMDIDLQNKRIEIGNIQIKTPAGHGFKKENMITIERVFVQAESLNASLLKFNEISVSGLDVFFEAHADKTNIGVLKNKLKSTPKETQEPAKTEGGEPIKVIINKLEITQSTLHPSILLSDKIVESVALPPIQLRGIGQNSNGVVAGQAIEQVLTALINAASRTGLSAGFFSGVTSIIDRNLEDVKSKAKSLEGQLKGIFGN